MTIVWYLNRILLNYNYCKILFTLHKGASYKQLGAGISQNCKPIALFSRKLSKPQCNYTIIEKELISIVCCIKQFFGVLFGYEINIYLYHKNLFYASTQSEYQRVMH